MRGAREPKANNKKRIQPRINDEIVRRAKSKAAMLDLPLEYIIEQLLTAWVAGNITFSSYQKIRQGEK